MFFFEKRTKKLFPGAAGLAAETPGRALIRVRRKSLFAFFSEDKRRIPCTDIEEIRKSSLALFYPIPTRVVIDRHKGRKHFFLKKRSKNFLRLGARRGNTRPL